MYIFDIATYRILTMLTWNVSTYSLLLRLVVTSKHLRTVKRICQGYNRISTWKPLIVPKWQSRILSQWVYSSHEVTLTSPRPTHFSKCIHQLEGLSHNGVVLNWRKHKMAQSYWGTIGLRFGSRLSTENNNPWSTGSLRHFMIKVFCAILITAPLCDNNSIWISEFHIAEWG